MGGFPGTVSSLLGNAVRILAEHHDLQDHLRRNPTEIPTFVEEALRLESPFRYLMRSVPNDTTLGTVNIPAGATVLLLWGAANRDAAEFEQPDEVDLQRQVPRHHVSFGRGIHYCVGATLSRIEAGSVLTELLERTCGSSPVEPCSVADMVLWFCSEQASYVTGATVPIDGGQPAGHKPPQLYRQGEGMAPT